VRAKSRPPPARSVVDMQSTTTPWALGDYHRFAKHMVWGFGPTLVAACGISPGQRVLDVAAGTGNTAIRAALAGADVVACDLEPAPFEAGRREARGSAGFLDFYKRTFGPVVAIYERLDEDGRAELDRAELEFVDRWNTGAPDGPAHVPVEYMLIVGRR